MLAQQRCTLRNLPTLELSLQKPLHNGSLTLRCNRLCCVVVPPVALRSTHAAAATPSEGLLNGRLLAENLPSGVSGRVLATAAASYGQGRRGRFNILLQEQVVSECTFFGCVLDNKPLKNPLRGIFQTCTNTTCHFGPVSALQLLHLLICTHCPYVRLWGKGLTLLCWVVESAVVAPMSTEHSASMQHQCVCIHRQKQPHSWCGNDQA